MTKGKKMFAGLLILLVGYAVWMQTCPECGKAHYIGMNPEDFKRCGNSNTPIDEVFPNEPAEIRELLITGICPECWNKLFPKE